MIHVHTLSDLTPDRPSLLTLGAFDGVHRGHQTLIRNLVTRAHEKNFRAAVVTFFPHPSIVLRGRRDSFYINTPDERADLLAALGVDVVVTHPFDHPTSLITATNFADQLLAALNFKELWCGEDFAFGHNREGNVKWLEEYGRTHDFTVHVQKPITAVQATVSSSRVRTAIADGDIPLITTMLGHPLRISGVVVEGNKRGRAIGIPTANLKVWNERAYPARGVYACKAILNNQTYNAVTNIGVRPTFDSQMSLSVEAHLLDFDQDIYGQTISLDFIARLRQEKKFNGVNELVAQIKSDIEQAKVIL
ncbi:MAG: bifunctional riboflavin kinase/FAD synthetase, partial [Chloroflexi bacterium]|nr:bifunctional riboflavin kinase/FAD synthetase [Chloroflexota bacterium]